MVGMGAMVSRGIHTILFISPIITLNTPQTADLMLSADKASGAAGYFRFTSPTVNDTASIHPSGIHVLTSRPPPATPFHASGEEQFELGQCNDQQREGDQIEGEQHKAEHLKGEQRKERSEV